MTTLPTEQLGRRPVPGPPQELIACTSFLFVRLGLALKERAMDAFEVEGFNPKHHGVLALLEEGTCETQASIADALNLDRSLLVGLLDSLEEHGLIERRRDTNDRRRHVVSLTAEGKRKLQQFRTIVKKIEQDFLEPLDDESRRTLHMLLLRLASHHDARCAPDEPS
jgi:DNA-binding MarR family transcriptional regulator